LPYNHTADRLRDMNEVCTDESVPVSEIVGVVDIARMLHVKETTVGAWAAKRVLLDGNGTGFPDPFMKLSGRYLMFRKQDVINWYKAYQPAKGHIKVGYLDETEGQQ
jgi:hypothetical protein